MVVRSQNPLLAKGENNGFMSSYGSFTFTKTTPKRTTALYSDIVSSRDAPKDKIKA